MANGHQQGLSLSLLELERRAERISKLPKIAQALEVEALVRHQLKVMREIVEAVESMQREGVRDGR